MQTDFDRTKSLKELEDALWGEISPDLGRPGLERRVYCLVCTPLCEFSVNDLRFFLSQGLNLDYIVPITIEALEQDPWTPGGLAPGTVLAHTLLVEDEFWLERPDLWRALGPVLDRAVSLVPTLDEMTYGLITDLPGQYDWSELEFVMRVQKSHQEYMLRYLGLEYARTSGTCLAYIDYNT